MAVRRFHCDEHAWSGTATSGCSATGSRVPSARRSGGQGYGLQRHPPSSGPSAYAEPGRRERARRRERVHRLGHDGGRQPPCGTKRATATRGAGCERPAPWLSVQPNTACSTPCSSSSRSVDGSSRRRHTGGFAPTRSTRTVTEKGERARLLRRRPGCTTARRRAGAPARSSICPVVARSSSRSIAAIAAASSGGRSGEDGGGRRGTQSP